MQQTLTADGATRLSRAVAYGARPALRAFAAAIIIATVGAIVFSALIAHPNSRVLSEFSDAALAMRMYDVIDQAGSTPFTFTHDDLNGAPEGFPALPAVQVAAPIQPSFVWLTKDALGTIGAVNIFLLSGLLLTGIAMFLLLDRCRFGFLPSVFGALLVTFNPWMYERAISGHVAFAHGWVLILLLYALLRLREQRTVRRALLAGGAYGLCFLMASYSGLLATSLVAGFAVVDLAFAGSRSERLWTSTLLVAIFGVMAISLLPGAIAFVLDQDRVTRSLARSSLELKFGGASPLHYVLPSPRHPLVGDLSERLRPWDFFNEKTVFFGYATILLAIGAVVALFRERRSRVSWTRRTELSWLALAFTPIALILSFGPSVAVAGTDIPMPGYLIGEVTTFYRVYARLGFVVAIGLAILAAFTLNRLGAKRWGGAAVAAAIALTAFELLPGRVGAMPIDRAPAYDVWLARQPKGIAAHYPMMTNRASGRDPGGERALLPALHGATAVRDLRSRPSRNAGGRAQTPLAIRDQPGYAGNPCGGRGSLRRAPRRCLPPAARDPAGCALRTAPPEALWACSDLRAGRAAARSGSSARPVDGGGGRPLGPRAIAASPGRRPFLRGRAVLQVFRALALDESGRNDRDRQSRGGSGDDQHRRPWVRQQGAASGRASGQQRPDARCDDGAGVSQAAPARPLRSAAGKDAALAQRLARACAAQRH